MAILCRLGRHRAIPSDRWNDGYFFSRCGRCGCDLVRRRDKWRAVPKGYRVVWRPRLPGQIDWTAWTRDRKAAKPAVEKVD